MDDKLTREEVESWIKEVSRRICSRMISWIRWKGESDHDGDEYLDSRWLEIRFMIGLMDKLVSTTIEHDILPDAPYMPDWDVIDDRMPEADTHGKEPSELILMMKAIQDETGPSFGMEYYSYSPSDWPRP